MQSCCSISKQAVDIPYFLGAVGGNLLVIYILVKGIGQFLIIGERLRQQSPVSCCSCGTVGGDELGDVPGPPPAAMSPYSVA